MKALQDELKSLRQLLEQQQQQQQHPSSFQYPLWQPGQFPFSSPVHSAPTHENSIPPFHETSVPPTHKNSATPNHREFVPSTHKGSAEHTGEQSATTISDSSNSHSSTSSHGNRHTTSTVASDPPPAKLHTQTSKVAMDTAAQQQHAQPVEVNNATNTSINKSHPKKKTNKLKDNKKYKKFSSPSQQSDLSDSSVSLSTSSDASTLSVFNSAKLSPDELDGFQGDESAATETMRVPSNANLSTWVCPLCGGRSIIVDRSGTKRHRHRQPEQVKRRSRSTQCDRISYRHTGQSTGHPHYKDKSVNTECGNFSKPRRYTPTVRNSGLHYSSDVPSNRNGGSYHNNNVLGNRSSGLQRGYTRGNRLHYSSDTTDTPRLKSSGLHYKNTVPGIRSSVLQYNSDTPVVRSTGTQYNRRNRSHRRPSKRYLRSLNGDTITFTHPKAASTPMVVETHDCSSDSSDICPSRSPTITHRPMDYIVLKSPPCRRRRCRTQSHVTRCCHGDRYLTTSSNEDDEPCCCHVSR